MSAAWTLTTIIDNSIFSGCGETAFGAALFWVDGRTVCEELPAEDPEFGTVTEGDG